MEPTIQNTAETPALQQQLQDVEALEHELKRLLVRHEATLDAEGIRKEVEILERWMESYRRGLAAADKISCTGMTWLADLRDRLKLSADERQRLEGEGGNPASKEQAEKTEELLKAIRSIERVMPDIQHMLCKAEQPQETKLPENA